MMGLTHASSGAVLFLAAVPLLPWTLDPWEIAIGAFAAAGAALLPDLDHPQSSIARALGPITGLLTRLVSLVSGGHRHGTHSILGIVVFGGFTAALGALDQPLLLGVWVAFLVAIASATINLRFTRSTFVHVSVCMLAAGFLIAGSWISQPQPAVLVTAVVIGATAHILGDILTPQGCPLFWPAPRPRAALPLVATDGMIERWIIAPALTVILLVQIVTLAWPWWQGAT